MLLLSQRLPGLEKLKSARRVPYLWAAFSLTEQWGFLGGGLAGSFELWQSTIPESALISILCEGGWWYIKDSAFQGPREWKAPSSLEIFFESYKSIGHFWNAYKRIKNWNVVLLLRLKHLLLRDYLNNTFVP